MCLKTICLKQLQVQKAFCFMYKFSTVNFQLSISFLYRKKQDITISMPSIVMLTLVLSCQYMFSFDTFIRHSKIFMPPTSSANSKVEGLPKSRDGKGISADSSHTSQGFRSTGYTVSSMNKM